LADRTPSGCFRLSTFAFVGHVVSLVIVFGAFVFLVGTTLRNRLFQRLRRLRHPRYLIGFLIGIAYIWGVFLRPYPASVAGPPGRSGLALGDLPLRLASLGLTLFVARWWLFESGTPVLAFAPSEVQFLFPAPLRRRDLLTYKLVTAQMQLLISAAVVAIFSARWDQSMPMALRLVAAWVLLMTLYLHHLGASLVRVGITQTRPGTKRPLLAVAVVVVGATILLVGLARAWPTMSGAADLRGGLAAAGVVLHGAALATVLWPFRAALAPMFASAPAAWARAVAFAVPLLVAHYVWVLRMNVPFEEAAADASTVLAHRIRVMRQRMLGGTVVEPRNGPVTRRRAAWFALPSSGQPSVAIVWKNIVALQRRGWRSIWPAAVFIVAMGVASSTGHGSWTDSAAVAVAAGAAWLAWALAILGPMTFQNDLRQDVAYLAVLRTYPLSGVRIVVAEVASSVIPLLVAQLGLITFACIVCPARVSGQEIGLAPRFAVFGLSALVLPGLDATSATIGNAMALLFPTARALGATVGGAGTEGVGQIVVARLASVLASLATLLLPAGAAAGVYWIAQRVAPPSIAALLAVAAVVVAYGGQLYGLIRWLGRVFERTDAVAVSAVD
jgi:ABC-2 type transport system permease protein